MKLRVDVTAQDIKLGCQGGKYACPVALAFDRAIRRAAVRGLITQDTMFALLHAEVMPWWIKLPGGGYQILSVRVQDFICNYDCGKKVKPLSFMLDLTPLYDGDLKGGDLS